MVIAASTPLVLGSASPRRREILATLRLPVTVAAADVDESPLPGETAGELLERIVEAKLSAVAARVVGQQVAGVVVADTIVAVDGEILGKPGDVAAALVMIRKLAGRAHTVQTRYAISVAPETSRAVVARTVTSRVVMREASEEEMERYAATGEGLDKAGAYAVQGLGGFLVERVEGSYTNVVGLPACELIVDLRRAGLLASYP